MKKIELPKIEPKKDNFSLRDNLMLSGITIVFMVFMIVFVVACLKTFYLLLQF